MAMKKASKKSSKKKPAKKSAAKKKAAPAKRKGSAKKKAPARKGAAKKKAPAKKAARKAPAKKAPAKAAPAKKAPRKSSPKKAGASGSSKKKAIDLIVKMSTDRGLYQRYRDEPDKVMDEAGLSSKEKEVLKTGDADGIRKHLGDDAPPGCIALFDAT
jgi:flagellar biosynthesis GTPase FlhF